MSDLKRTCVGCDAWTSSVGVAYRDELPCPHCGLPWEAAAAVEKARASKVEEETVVRLIAAEKRAAAAEAKVAEYDAMIEAVKMAVN